MFHIQQPIGVCTCISYRFCQTKTVVLRQDPLLGRKGGGLFLLTSPEKQTNKQQNCYFLCQICRLVHKVHQIGDAFYNLTLKKLHAARSSLSTQVMTTETLFDRYKLNVLIVTLGG